MIGHSFITGLHRYFRLNPRLRNFNLDVNSFVFDFHARGGLQIPHLVNSREFLSLDILPDLCYIQIEENDFLNRDDQFIARSILSLASYLHEGIGISLVIIGQLFRRQPWALSAEFNQPTDCTG